MATFRIVIAVALLALGGFLVFLMVFPTEISVQCSTDINASPGKIFPYLCDLKKWEEWTPWSKRRYPDLIQEYGAIATGEGAELRWQGPKMGEGSLKITQSEPDLGIEYQLRTLAGKIRFEGKIVMNAIDGHTVVTWSDGGDLGYFGALLKGTVKEQISADFDAALARLKTLCEES